MNTTELYWYFRSEMHDQEEPYLWEDVEVLHYLDDAQKMFCRKTEGISDSRTADVTQIEVEAATEWYAISPLILKIRSAYRTDTGRPIDFGNLEHFNEMRVVFDGREGPLRLLIQGLEANALRAYPVPNEDVTVQMSVFRLPLVPLDDFDLELEIAEQHHRHLLMWMKHLAYDKQDAETLDKTKSRDFEQKFYDYCDMVKAEQTRARRAHHPVAYGGI